MRIQRMLDIFCEPVSYNDSLKTFNREDYRLKMNKQRISPSRVRGTYCRLRYFYSFPYSFLPFVFYGIITITSGLCVQDDQYARVLWAVDECGFHSGKPVRQLHPVQLGRNTRPDPGHQNPQQLRTEGVAVLHAIVVQQPVHFDSVRPETSVVLIVYLF